MNSSSLTNKFGFSEMYEWSQIPIDKYRYGRFVEFDPDYPDKIRLSVSGTNVVGVASINAVDNISDDMDHWWLENQFDEFGDILMKNETLAVGVKKYDNMKEMSYIETQKYDHLIPIKRETFRSDVKYNKRSSRPEWSVVTMMGKCIVTDYGKCAPGTRGKILSTDLLQYAGTLVPVEPSEEGLVKSYYVIRRVSENTVMILLQ